MRPNSHILLIDECTVSRHDLAINSGGFLGEDVVITTFSCLAG